MIVDEELNWEHHVLHVADKIQSNKHLISISQKLLPTHYLRSIYYSHIFSHLSYALGVWGSMINKGKKDDISRLQKQCLCYVCKLSLTDEYQRHHLVKFPDMFKIELCKL